MLLSTAQLPLDLNPKPFLHARPSPGAPRSKTRLAAFRLSHFKVSHFNSASLLWRCSACRELLKHLGFADMLPPAPEAEPTPEESLAATEATLGRLSTQGDDPSLGASSPVADSDADAAPAPVGSTLSGEDFFSNLGGAGAKKMRTVT